MNKRRVLPPRKSAQSGKPSTSRPKRKATRIPGFDYSEGGIYFVTICTHQKRHILGSVTGENVRLNELGRIAEDAWLDLEIHYPSILLDEFIIMPNHSHGIVILHPERWWTSCTLTDDSIEEQEYPSLSEIVRAFKSYSAKRINQLRGTTGEPVWQRSFYDHVVRNEKSLEEIRRYIRKNPVRWSRHSERSSDRV